MGKAMLSISSFFLLQEQVFDSPEQFLIGTLDNQRETSGDLSRLSQKFMGDKEDLNGKSRCHLPLVKNFPFLFRKPFLLLFTYVYVRKYVCFVPSFGWIFFCCFFFFFSYLVFFSVKTFSFVNFQSHLSRATKRRKDEKRKVWIVA